MLKLKVNDVVCLVDDLPKEALAKGAIGTVVAAFSAPEEAFEVEFCDERGATLAQVTLSAHQIKSMN
jgi:hypothetical protein